MRSSSRDSRTQPVPSMSAWADGSASTANTASGAASIVVDAVTRSVSIPVRPLAGPELIAARTSCLRRSAIPKAAPLGHGNPEASHYACSQAPSRGHLRSGMAKLIYVANVSLDGYIEDAHGSFEWTEPNDEVFTFITDLVRPAGNYLYGRRLYESMAVWETATTLAAQSEP